MKRDKIPDADRPGLGPLWDDDLDHRKSDASRRSSSSWRRKALKYGLVWFIGTGLGFGFVEYQLRRSPNYGKPLGRGIPEEWPDEARRVTHPRGFSLIYPPNWDTRPDEDSPAISLYPKAYLYGSPRSLLARRYHPWIGACQLNESEPIVTNGWRKILFQGQPAWEWSHCDTSSDFERPPLFSYHLEFERAGRRYRLSYSLPQNRTTLPPILSLYLNTFRPEPAVMPVSSP